MSSHMHIRNISSSINISSLSRKSYKILKSYHQKYSVLYIQTKDIEYFDLVSHYPELYESLYYRFRLQQEHIHIITLYSLFYELLVKLKPHLQEKLDRLNMNWNSSGKQTISMETYLIQHISSLGFHLHSILLENILLIKIVRIT